MPTLFARRYMRKLEEVGNTEKVVGIVVLLLLACVLAVFATQVAANKDYLFDVEDTAYHVADQARELTVASQVLPALGDPGWRPSGDPEAFAADELSAVVGAEATLFVDSGVRWIYRQKYERADRPSSEIAVLVCDVSSPAQASELWRARDPAGAEALNVGQAGWLTGDKLRAGFWNGRYYTELRASTALPSTMTLPKAARAIAAVQLSYSQPLTAQLKPAIDGGASRHRDAPKPSNPFPDAGLPGWHTPRKVSRFTPDNLYQKINGRADAYLTFHVAGLTFGTYYHQTNTDRTVDVYWYDMGGPQNAFGMYRSEAPRDAAKVAIGREGYQAGGAVFFWKGASYVQVLPTSFDDGDARAALRIAQRLAQRIEDYSDSAWAQTVLPQAGRVENSPAYIAQDAFGLGFLNEVHTAEFDFDGQLITMFVHRAADESSARGLFDQYVGFFQRYGRVIGKPPEGSRLIVAGEVGGMIDVVVVEGRYLGGVAGAENAELARKAAEGFLDEMGSYSEPRP